MMASFKLGLTFNFVNQILWCDYSNETSSVVLSHGTNCFPAFHKISENWKVWRFKLGHFWAEIQV